MGWWPKRGEGVEIEGMADCTESMLDPLSPRLALAPIDDELFTEGDRQAMAVADEWQSRIARSARKRAG
jgi:hypothetical protein